MHLAEIDRLYVNGKLLSGSEIFIEPNSADLYDLSAEMNGEIIEN